MAKKKKILNKSFFAIITIPIVRLVPILNLVTISKTNCLIIELQTLAVKLSLKTKQCFLRSIVTTYRSESYATKTYVIGNLNTTYSK